MKQELLDVNLFNAISHQLIPIAHDAMANTTPTYGAGSVHYPSDNRLREGWIQGHVIIRVEPEFCPMLYELFPNIIQVAISILVRNGYLAPHRDAKVSGMSRYHIPLFSDRTALWWDEINGVVRMVEGYIYGPVPYTALHFAVGSHRIYRAHLLLDVVDTMPAVVR